MHRTDPGTVLASLALGALVSQAFAAGRADDYCALLSAPDFQAAGVQGARAPSVNPDEQGAYCVYAGKSSATGGIEFDVFETKSVADARDVYATVRGETGPASKVAGALPGADASEIAKVKGPPAFTMIAARKGRLVFAIGVPTTAKSQDAVVSLAKLVLQRGEKMTR